MSDNSPFYIVSDDRNVTLNFLNAASDEFDFYADAYYEAGKALSEKMIHTYNEGNRPNDLGGLPVIFLYRHALELYLKSSIYIGSDILKLTGVAVGEIKALQFHELRPLVESLKSILDSLHLEFDPWDFHSEGFRDYNDFESFISSWENVDRFSFSARYPTRKSGEAALPKHFQFHLPSFYETMNQVLQTLSGFNLGLREIRNLAGEIPAYRQDITEELGN